MADLDPKERDREKRGEELQREIREERRTYEMADLDPKIPTDKNSTSLREQFSSITPIEKIDGEISGYSHLTDDVVDVGEQDLSQAHLHNLQKEQADSEGEHLVVPDLRASAEVEGLMKLKASRMKELVIKRRSELDDVCRKVLIEPDTSTVPEKFTATVDSAVNRKEMMESMDRLFTAFDEEVWLEDYNQDQNRYSAGIGADTNLKRAELARVTVKQIPAIVDNLINQTIAWENEGNISSFLNDGVRLVSMLEDYKLARQQKEEKKRLYRVSVENDSLLQQLLGSAICTSHVSNDRAQKISFCVTCESFVCSKCLSGASHNGHELFKLYKQKGYDVVLLADFPKRLLPLCLSVQTYNVKAGVVVYLLTRPGGDRGNPSSYGGLPCICGRKLLASDKKFCSIQCSAITSAAAIAAEGAAAPVAEAPVAEAAEASEAAAAPVAEAAAAPVAEAAAAPQNFRRRSRKGKPSRSPLW